MNWRLDNRRHTETIAEARTESYFSSEKSGTRRAEEEEEEITDNEASLLKKKTSESMQGSDKRWVEDKYYS